MEVFKVSNDPQFEEKFWDVIFTSTRWCCVAMKKASAGPWNARSGRCRWSPAT